ncbi:MULTISPECIES: hypothetical protein [Xenorhabdus]|uniref:hypothetical protein n=1 Tax=Xenorhabdus TaxID=626 RepID=UPI000649C39C|nr:MULTISPECIES: hypothetical protein [Xenorhabdus]KLU16507.1 hypothetical protein AAY47_04540 [Xenorhabdus griffiniae]KOP32470.1 hypothetical protein AFK69_15335 [Xenorhabdus sp. GDc328]
MALVKVIAGNLFSGANLQKLEVGDFAEVDQATAQRWALIGLVELIEDSVFEVATPTQDTNEPEPEPEKPPRGKGGKKDKSDGDNAE